MYDDKKWYQYPQTIYLTIFILLSAISFFLKPTYQVVFLVIWGILLFLGIVTVIFPLNKKRIKTKLDVEPKKSKHSHWANTEFREAQIKKFYDALVENRVLNKNKKDIDLLTSYEKLFKDEAELLKSKERLLLGGGILLLFILPVWNTSTELILSDGQNFVKNIKLVFKFLFLIYCLIYFLNLMRFWIEEILNKTYWKFIDIKRNLHQIKLNIELKNASQSSSPT
ncbi:hypothetical protein DN752_23180 [Echinicola strongylocentroti]|uniref:Uncharacterized protein n=1 Tax=Echinicola strongylocentroti TaxID=1795355 RepID=A0A2Z4INW8_9BACT|nr:hypothetical protein [Echinicola strongylocentroti]AWW32811.1 hypothetical protein DN752_23180 [Echinicola strongylocentroti]